MNELQHFAERARGFQLWIEESQSEGGSLAREALLQLVGLYNAGLELPSPFLSAAGEEHSMRLGNAEVDRVRLWCGRLPFNLYSEVFDSTVVPADEPVIGDISDDISDIYLDVVTGLRLFDAGQFDHALWEWGFNFRIHWGKHATDAIRAIHLWLVSNDPDHLALPNSEGAA
jgi:hypothetical protein